MFKCLEVALINQKCNHEIKSSVNSRMPATTQFRIFHLPIAFKKYKD